MNDDHDRLRALVTKVVEAAADPAESAEVDAHLASCPECRAALDAERRSREAMRREARAFSEGYDAGRLEADLRQELRTAAAWSRGLAALGTAFGALTLVLYLRPMGSQPDAWSAALPLSAAFWAGLLWIRRRQDRMEAIARAAAEARGGYRTLERARVEVDIRELRACARFGFIGAPALPLALGVFGFVERLRLRHAFPDAVVQVNLSGALWNAAGVSVFLIGVSLVCLRKARRLESAHAP